MRGVGSDASASLWGASVSLVKPETLEKDDEHTPGMTLRALLLTQGEAGACAPSLRALGRRREGSRVVPR